MLICPACGSKILKSKNNCPNCNAYYYVFDNKIFPENPVEKILTLYQDLMTKKLSRELNKRVPFVINRKGVTYRYEVARIKQLIKEADYDIDILAKAIQVLFDSHKHSFRFNGSIGSLIPSISVGLAIARSIVEEERKKQERQEKLSSIDKLWDNAL